MRSLPEWFDLYGESHRNPVNVRVHKVCVPAILWSLLGVLEAWHFFLAQLLVGFLVTGAMIFYAVLGLRPFFVMCGVLALCLLSFRGLEGIGFPLLPFATTVFIVAWIGQFYGHHVEGRKPSFFQDLQFLLIGPLWVMKGFFR